ncbi:hypothetical protein J1N35_023493 [Gossypium stocksii]|uniref:Uncharacterized protein n=1 Tax=Gossypium stocksii TaxID=47602 RepID=A0A9D3VJX5_9ROSI|nr:hypothetical protein J1N35_023493 [Gossypium stocksii]
MEKVWTLTQNINKNNQSTLVSERTGFINFRQWGFKWRYQDIACKRFCLLHYFCYADHIRYKNIPYLITWIDAARTNDLEKIDFHIAIDCKFLAIKMPPTIFQCQKLVIGNLDCIYRAVICLDAPKKVSF